MPMRFVVFEYCEKSDMFNYLVTGPMEKQQMYVCVVAWCDVHTQSMCIKTHKHSYTSRTSTITLYKNSMRGVSIDVLWSNCQDFMLCNTCNCALLRSVLLKIKVWAHEGPRAPSPSLFM